MLGCGSKFPQDLAQTKAQSNPVPPNYSPNNPPNNPQDNQSPPTTIVYQKAQVAFVAEEWDLPSNISISGFGGMKRRELFKRRSNAYYFKPNRGWQDEVRIKLMWLETTEQAPLLFVSLDVVFVGPEFKADLAEALAEWYSLPEQNIFIHATHTHSGPGGVSKNRFLGFAAADRFNPKVYQATIQQVVRMAQQAVSQLQEAQLYRLQFDSENLVRNRRGADQPLDQQVNMLMARSTHNNQWLGAMMNFPIHGTSYGTSNLRMSSDAPGAFERILEDYLEYLNRYESHSVDTLPPAVLFSNGALGDVTPVRGGEQGINFLARSFVKQVDQHWDLQKPVHAQWRTWSTQIDLGAARGLIKNCVENRYIDRFPSWFGQLPLSAYFERDIEISFVQLDQQLMVTWPGEPTSELGLTMRQLAMGKGFENMWLLGTTNGYYGYFLSPQEYSKGGYEVCANFYDPHAGNQFVQAFQKAM